MKTFKNKITTLVNSGSNEKVTYAELLILAASNPPAEGWTVEAQLASFRIEEIFSDFLPDGKYDLDEEILSNVKVFITGFAWPTRDMTFIDLHNYINTL